tara:strand:- start:1187 stop:1462 length:276 start_codon:yes stop_codon:yes gene_type:complete
MEVSAPPAPSIERIALGPSEMDSLLESLFSKDTSVSQETPLSNSHISWMKRELIKLAKCQISLAETELKLVHKEKNVREMEEKRRSRNGRT